ncbi:hypothetical protein BB558_000570 [Smittium angustum]|uniref:UDENN domain-containing protein n=1 Tax=Smittium angustum TaxID=133377 RepID=A0A2U1JDS0_SMIAN|nr:hypothetical protein BB558_000570 [Smittium angustum]
MNFNDNPKAAHTHKYTTNAIIRLEDIQYESLESENKFSEHSPSPLESKNLSYKVSNSTTLNGIGIEFPKAETPSLLSSNDVSIDEDQTKVDEITRRMERVLTVLTSNIPNTERKKYNKPKINKSGYKKDEKTRCEINEKAFDSETSTLENNLVFNEESIKKLQEWIICIAITTFDEDSGPAILFKYPKTEFDKSEEKAIRFSSMPDSTINEICDSVYSFKFRTNTKRPNFGKDTVFLNAYVFFRQRKDPEKKRGGSQGSVVIITHLELHGLFLKLAEIIGPLYFDFGQTVLEAAVQNIIDWPHPQSGKLLVLPLLDTVLRVDMPIPNTVQLLETSLFDSKSFTPNEDILASIVPEGILRNFKSNLSDLWICWELMILAESLVVFADSPARSFEVVCGLVDLIYPIKYCGDFRPYFTLQDPDFFSIVSSKRVHPNTVLGVTNPFFKDSLNHWPHKLVLKSASRIQKIKTGGGLSRKKTISSSIISLKPSKNNSSIFNGGSSGANFQIKAVSKKMFEGINPSTEKSGWGMYTKYVPLVTPDEDMIASVDKSKLYCHKQPWHLDNSIRRYFSSLTEQFLTPLNRYFSTLVPPVPRNFVKITKIDKHSFFCIYTCPPSLSQWKNSDFFVSLVQHGLPEGLIGKSTTTSKATAAASAIAAAIFSKQPLKQVSTNTNISNSGTNLMGTNTFGQNSSSQKHMKNHRNSFTAPKINSEWREFYSNFLKCGNFATWLAKRSEEAKAELWKRYFASIANYDILEWMYASGTLILTNVTDNVHETPQLVTRKVNNPRNSDGMVALLNGTSRSNYLEPERSGYYKSSSLSPFIAISSLDKEFDAIPIEPSRSTSVTLDQYNKIKGYGSNNENISRLKNGVGKHVFNPKTDYLSVSGKTSPVLIRSNSQTSFMSTKGETYTGSQVAVLGSRGALVGFINSPSQNTDNGNEKLNPKKNILNELSKGSVNGEMLRSKSENAFGINSPHTPGHQKESKEKKKTFSAETLVKDIPYNEIPLKTQRSVEELISMADFLATIAGIPINKNSTNGRGECAHQNNKFNIEYDKAPSYEHMTTQQSESIKKMLHMISLCLSENAPNRYLIG